VGEWQPARRDCHDIHDVDNENLALIAREVNGTPVSFVEDDVACGEQGNFIHSICDPPSYDGICEVCHTATNYHVNVPGGDHAHARDTRCTACHPHSSGFLPSSESCSSCHGEPPDGTEFPNRAGSHAVHLTAANGPNITECYDCHASEGSDTHMNELASFASGVDTDLDGNIDLAEADVCNTCHSEGGPLDGVNDPVIGAKANWHDGVYEGDVLKPDKLGWCTGCHDIEGAVVNGVQAPPVVGDNETWGDTVAGHGVNHVACTECHDPTLPHTDGVARTFSERFPLFPDGLPKPPEERELDKEVYNDGYRLLRRIDGGRALEVPREAGPHTPEDHSLCFWCHDEIKLLGVPANYYATVEPPPYLQLSEGVAQTNYRNESEWGHGWEGNEGKPANIHWKHMALDLSIWNIDHGSYPFDSAPTCVTCHNPHGARGVEGGPTAVMTMADLAITFDVYNDGEMDHEYGYIGSDDFYNPGGDLYCGYTCHPLSGPGGDPPNNPYEHTRYYRQWLDLRREECFACHVGDPGRATPLPGSGKAGSRVWEER
jgi:hypothetical protein